MATTVRSGRFTTSPDTTWRSAPYLDTTMLRVRPSQVLLKVPSNDGVTISFNKLIPAFQGSTVGNGQHLHGPEPWLAGAAT